MSPASTTRNSCWSPSRPIKPSAMYKSVGKFPASETITRRPGRKPSATPSALKIFTEVESAAITVPPGAPSRRPILSPTRSDRPIQPASFHDRMSPWPHSWPMTAARRPGVAIGSGPSELPSR